MFLWFRRRMRAYLKMNFVSFLAIGALLVATYFIFSLTSEIHESVRTIHEKESQIRSLRSKIEKLQFQKTDPSLPIIYVITPTYSRPVQKAELTRLSNVFRLVPNLHWIVVEDSSQKTNQVGNLLQEFPHNSTQLNILTPKEMKIQPKEKWWKKPRGVLQRNLALSWLRDNVAGTDGVIYFADDDNTYTVDLFEEIRATKKVSVLPVGLVGGVIVEKPKVTDGKVSGWEVGWGAERMFAIDMAGFALNLKFFISHPDVKFLLKVKLGHQETEFLKQLVTLKDLEPFSLGRVLVWHTRTETPKLTGEEKFFKKFGKHSDHGIQV